MARSAAERAPPTDKKARRLVVGAATAVGAPASQHTPGAIAGGHNLIKTTIPDSIDRHEISDEELTMLVDPRRSSLSEQKWAFIGIAGGAFPGAASGLYHYFRPGEMSLVDLGHVLLFTACAALAFWVHRTDKKLAESPTNLAARIRARTRIREQGYESR